MDNAKIIFFAVMIAFSGVSTGFSELTRKRAMSGDQFVLTYYNNKKKVATEVCDMYGKLIKISGKLPNGIVKEYRGGRLFMRIPIKNGKKEGIEKEFRDDGELMHESNYKDGKLEGFSRGYYPGGKIFTEEFYTEDRQDGTGKAYYNNGKIAKEESYQFGMMDGPFKEYFENGNLMSEYNYKEDNLDGSYKIYLPDGKLMRDWEYKEGKREGFCREYFNHGGKLHWECNYKDDVPDGICRVYTESQELDRVDTYEKGVKIDSKQNRKSEKVEESQENASETTSSLAQSLSDTLTGAAVLSNRFNVMETTKVGKILKAKKIEVPRDIDPAAAVKFGKHLGANFLVIGYVEKLPANGSFDIEYYLTNVEDAKIVSKVLKNVKPGKGTAAITKIEKEWSDLIDELDLKGELKKRGSMAILISDHGSSSINDKGN